MIMGNFGSQNVDGEIVQAIDFMVEQVWILFFPY